MNEPGPSPDPWPPLPLASWSETYTTLHLWTQVVGKVQLALAPPVNHWWAPTLRLTPRGLSTSTLYYGRRALSIDLDFLSHRLVLATSDGDARAMPLAPRSVADFHASLMALLEDVGVTVRTLPRPVEVAEAIPFPEDRAHASYDADAVERCWRAFLAADRVLREFRARFTGKCSPVQFFWGGFDLAVTRFSGETAPPHPGGVPNLADWVTREAYSHEVSSAGFWPGSDALPEPAFYSYAYPEPEGFATAAVRPGAAYYHRELREYVLPYDSVRGAADPEGSVLEFLQSTYEAAAEPGGWDRAALERSAESLAALDRRDPRYSPRVGHRGAGPSGGEG